MSEVRGYVLGQSEEAASRLALQDSHFAQASEALLDELELRPGMRVVEFGCGAGAFSARVLRRLGPDGVLVGVDGSEGLLAQAQAALAPAPFVPVLADVSTLGPWLAGADAVVARAMLHHVPLAEILLGRLRAAVRPGTLIGFLEPDFRSPLARIAHLEAIGRIELAPLRVWATAINQLYAANRVSPAVGATLSASMGLAGYRVNHNVWSECRSDAAMIENMRRFYDEVADKLDSLGILAASEIERQKGLLAALSLEGLPPAWGMFRVVATA